MTTHNAVRSFCFLLLAVCSFGLLTTSCKKSGGTDPDIDPREQYVGSYSGGFQIGINLAGIDLKPESGTAVVTISKAPNPKEIYVETTYNNALTEKLTAELTGSTFKVIDRTKDVITVNTTKYEGDYTSTGVFENNQVGITTVTEVRVPGGVVRRTGSITGTKK